MADAQAEFRRKKAFYDMLNCLDKSDNEDDLGVRDSIAAMNKATRPPQAAMDAMVSVVGGDTSTRDTYDDVLARVAATRSNPENIALTTAAPPILKRSHTVPNAVDPPATAVTMNEALPSSTMPPSLKTSVSLPEQASRSEDVRPGLGGKRKRSSGLRLAPEAQRYFTGLHLFFVPNNDVAKARRLRIEKAMQYGARWSKEWHEDITHIVVDNDLVYGDVLKAAGVTEIPDTIAVVNERYPSDCISWRQLMDPNSPIYEVKGRIVPERRTSTSTVASVETEKSLQIKPIKPKDGYVTYAPNDAEASARISEPSPQNLSMPVNVNATRGNSNQLHRTASGGSDISNENPAMARPSSLRRVSTVSDQGESEDVLQAAIVQARATKLLPLDDDEDPTAPSSSPPATDDDQDRSSDESHSKPNPKLKPRRNSHTQGDWQSKFTCMQPPTDPSTLTNPNAKTIAILQEMATHYDSIQDKWRTVSYRKAISALKKQTEPITTKAEAEKLPGVGTRLAEKIEEIFWTNRLRRLDSSRSDATDQAVARFAGIYGVGYNIASRWVQQGHRTFQDLLDHVDLTENQRVGIAHYEDFQTRIPRPEVAQHGEIVRRALKLIDPAFQVTVGGSYRRGAKDSGDIDCVITKPAADAAYLRNIVINTLVPALMQQGYLTVGLAVTHKDTGSMWHGACQLPTTTSPGQETTTPNTNTNPWRRVDLLLVPWDELGAALIYFTGNDIFNRSLRLLASKKGMHLNQKGLYKDVLKGPGRVKATEGVRIAGEDEREIFRILGVPWRDAESRNC